MFEGLVRQLILGYLGQYIKDIHKEQLKITLWNEEVFLENVELILEAFDYLELPFALKQGRVGRLSIRIPWKKLGWDPIIIILEDILVYASQREDEEWGTDEVERREFAGKKAKLATAELAKLSQRVCDNDNQTGKSFISYITAKIIDGIQVTIRNVHVVYGDMSNDKAQTVFGLKLTSLTAMKQNLTGLSSGKVRIGQVNKLIEIQGLEIYCRTFPGCAKDSYSGNGEESMSMVAASSQSDEHIHLLAPVNVSASLSVNRSGRLENNAAQYSIDVELSSLVLSLNEDQLQQILYLYDYLCTCRLREKYGRFRPWESPLSERPMGWQIKWWHYAQQSVLSDVRKRLKKTSWKYLGERVGRKRQYVKLYKLKLECLRKEEPLDDAIVLELDQMEKSSDIDDILSYRSAAEHEIQEFLLDPAIGIGANEANTAFDKLVDDDQSSNKPQGWLKWLSRGMLGAGGTDVSSQFSGVVSDEVIKDIYEATKFHPAPSPVLDASGSDGILLSSIKFSINRISATLRNRKFDCAIADLVFEENLVECMIWEESAVVTASVDAVEMMNPLNENVILLVKKGVSEERFLEVGKPSLNIQACIPKANREGQLTLKVMLEPIEVTCDPTFFLNVMELYTVLNSYNSHEERVLKSLNRIDDVKSRLISKTEYILSSRKRMMLDISLINVKIIIPWKNGKSEMHKLVLGLTAVTFTSKHDIGCFAPDINVPSQFVRNLVDIESSRKVELCRNKRVHSWPLFKLLQVQVDVEADIGDDMDQMHLKTGVNCDNLDVWLSHDIFYFWQTMHFEFPDDTGSPQFPLCGVNFRFALQKLSLLLTDQKWSSNGPLLEVIMGSLLFHGIITENLMEGSIESDLQVNYNNIHKVLWEPFIEPWKFEVSLRREHGKSALENNAVMTDVHLESALNLNINITESFTEVAFRAFDMIKDACNLMEPNMLPENSRFTTSSASENTLASRYSPYTVENLTSLPLVFYIYKGSKTADGFNISSLKDGKYVQPGSSYPVYIDDSTPDEHNFSFRTSHSSDDLGDRHVADAQHHYIIVQLEGTSTMSIPISIDLVGVSFFEVDFSNSSTNLGVENGWDTTKGASSYVVPVIIDVSVQRYTKLVRLYSTVILLNAASVPFEVRFDIPFGVSPKILDPVYPGHEFPLPLHLAETGRIRWRPLGSTYLWSEAYSISSILSNETKIKMKNFRSFVCYPSLPSSDPFRCCISVHDMCLPLKGRINKGSSSLYNHDSLKQSDKIGNQDHSNKQCIHLITLSSPLIVKNYLPVTVSLTIESGGVTRNMLLSEVETCFYHIDSSHDLSLTFNILGYRPSVLKFPRAEKFSEVAKFSGTKFSLSEYINFSSDSSKGSLYVTMEKVMVAFSGAREICIYVPFLLYNCCGFPLVIANSTNAPTTHGCTVPSCYDLDEQDLFLGKKDGLGLLSFNQFLHNDGTVRFPQNNNLVSTRTSLDTYHAKFLKNVETPKSSMNDKGKDSVSRSQSSVKLIDSDEAKKKKVNFCMYSPDPNISSSEIMVRVSRCQSDADVESNSDYAWSSQFFLVPPTGSATVLVPQLSNNASYALSVSSSAVTGPFSGRTRIINFQPRYVISNTCSKDMCFRQKGSDFIYHLKVGQHSHIHWTDITRELLISVRFDEPGWQWSGCFFPEHLGDTQLKMRNYVSGAVNMVRVEVQNADDAIRDAKIFGNPHGDSGTNLILLSDDDTGFMPYRIDNFSKERLRIYQQKCEAFETVVHSYTSCPYAWDEPCYPHRLTVEVFAERVIGSYTLDEAKEYKPVCLPATSEKPERRLLLSVHAEGALKVLSVIDSSYHSFDDIKTPNSSRLNDKTEFDQRQESSVLYKERLSIAIPFIGISVMSAQPQELLFACARNTVIDLVQSLDQQKFSLKIFALQIDNQLPTTPYPVILSFDHEYKQIPTSQVITKEDSLRVKGGHMKQLISDSSSEYVLSFTAAKWRNKDRALLSFEHINLRMADFHLELEQDVILGLFDFFKTVSSRFNSRTPPRKDSVMHPLSSNFSVNMTSKSVGIDQTEKSNGNRTFIESRSQTCSLLPSVVPIGAPWQKIYHLARKQKKIYIEVLEVAPVTLTLSFSSSPWMLRNGILTSGEYLIHRGLMALADVEGARIHLRQLTISHQMASLESIREILTIHYTRQLLHEMYKVFGSAGVIGNPMGFARSVGLGIRDFLSVPARSFMQSPAGLITGVAQGTTSLLSNTVYAISDATTQVSRAAHKGIVAFTMDDPTATEMERQQKGASSHGKGVINELLEGLTGLLQSPIRGAEKHGLPGVLSGFALGVTGLVARPAASILEVTEKTARSIRNRSKLYHMGSHQLRVRFPRPLRQDHPLKPYLWEEAVGVSVLSNSDDSLMLKDETLILSKPLKQGGKFVIVTERLLLIVSCSSLVNLGKPEFRGVPADPDWNIEAEITLDSVIHVDSDEEVVHIVGSSSDVVLRNPNQQRRVGGKRWYNQPTRVPLFQTNLECSCKEDAGELLKVILVMIEKGKERGWGGVHRLHQSDIR
ncbi:hypothetical protein SSX86_000671 [Deinandra increscens subsp. villosa]|uniref:Uncharacterized protein n=1 Tax=Deinandra increscens subsp. villosa TaxID=3103831 RepID=A0AAP0HBW4_9ASTR